MSDEAESSEEAKLDKLEKLLKNAVQAMRRWRAARATAFRFEEDTKKTIAELQQKIGQFHEAAGLEQVGAQQAMDEYLLQCKGLGVVPSRKIVVKPA